MDAAEHVTALVSRMFRLAPESLNPDIPLHRMHIDSLALEELRLVLEDELRVDLEDVHLTSRDTLSQLLAVVCEKAATV
ncbi:phosphopantetheine-binding protein [Streptomyces sp. NPDC005865]|uniref:acyl carrier protein n=1 Tax=Streptomyces sp. NPDC005865 TaxID=3155453 RepID=UPI0033DA4351